MSSRNSYSPEEARIVRHCYFLMSEGRGTINQSGTVGRPIGLTAYEVSQKFGISPKKAKLTLESLARKNVIKKIMGVKVEGEDLDYYSTTERGEAKIIEKIIDIALQSSEKEKISNQYRIGYAMRYLFDEK